MQYGSVRAPGMGGAKMVDIVADGKGLGGTEHRALCRDAEGDRRTKGGVE